MATVNLRRFANPSTIRAVRPPHLISLLEPYREYLKSRGFDFPETGDESIDHDALAKVLIAPDIKTPKDMIDAFYLIQEMATPEGMDALLHILHARGVEVDKNATPMDVAVQALLFEKKILESKHAGLVVSRVKSFEFYHTDGTKPPIFDRPSESQLRAMETELDDEFEKRNRGRGSKIILGGKDDAAYFLIRHGEPYKREESLEGTESSSVIFRPLRYDVLLYLPAIGELQINAKSKWEKELYRRVFGKHLFHNEDIFPGAQKYTLDPLITLGEECLACADIEGMEWVMLHNVQIYIGGEHWLVMNLKSENLFNIWKKDGFSFPNKGRIVGATFKVKFEDARTARSVVIKPANVARYARVGDILVEQWLKARGFILENVYDEQAEPLVA